MYIVSTYDLVKDEITETEIDLADYMAKALSAAGIAIRHSSEPRTPKQREPRKSANAFISCGPDGRVANEAAIKADSILASAVRGVGENIAYAGHILERICNIRQAVGGPIPTGAAEGSKAPAQMGHLGQLSEANAKLSSMLSSIEEELSRLEGLVG